MFADGITIAAIRLNADHKMIEQTAAATPVEYMQPQVRNMWMQRLHIAFGALGMSKRPEYLAFIGIIYGEEFDSSLTLTIGRIQALLEAINFYPEDLLPLVQKAYEKTRQSTR